ncbi:wax ester/triacylglycerol synthase domain-containing protein [Ilumatobacter coccineus]|nr:wax ester/triacylglycerol synthase domain-containing protein [Ilumatobacter coccineus]
MSGIAYDNKMSDAEGLMWRLEKDPHLSSNIGTVTILDRAPDFDLFRQRLLGASLRMPRLRQCVRVAPANIAPPTWVTDSNFDIDHHVRRIALPKPGDERALFDLASLITAEPFDRTRPLWQFTVVEGLKGNRAALVQKLHHTIADGESGVQLSLEYLDFERDAIPPSMPDPDEIDEAREAADADNDAADMVRNVLAGAFRLPLGVLDQVRELLADPTQIPDATSSAADTVRGLVTQLSDVDGARSPLWTERSTRRHLETASAPFTETRAAAHALGGTLNTAFMTIATEAASRYHAELGAPVGELRASMAISTRTEGSGANAFSLVRMLVPTDDIDIDERFRAIQAATDSAVRASSSASLDKMATFASALPTSMITRLARQQAHTIDFATSNVKGSPVPMYLAGAQLLSNYPIGPLSGVAFNLTLLSYLGRLDMGLNTDAAAVKEPDMLRRFIVEAVDRFTSLAT